MLEIYNNCVEGLCNLVSLDLHCVNLQVGILYNLFFCIDYDWYNLKIPFV